MSKYDSTGITHRPGDRVRHTRDPDWTGTILSVDLDCTPAREWGVTTCVVDWDGDYETDVRWTNRLEIIPS